MTPDQARTVCGETIVIDVLDTKAEISGKLAKIKSIEGVAVLTLGEKNL